MLGVHSATKALASIIGELTRHLLQQKLSHWARCQSSFRQFLNAGCVDWSVLYDVLDEVHDLVLEVFEAIFVGSNVAFSQKSPMRSLLFVVDRIVPFTQRLDGRILKVAAIKILQHFSHNVRVVLWKCDERIFTLFEALVQACGKEGALHQITTMGSELPKLRSDNKCNRIALEGAVLVSIESKNGSDNLLCMVALGSHDSDVLASMGNGGKLTVVVI